MTERWTDEKVADMGRLAEANGLSLPKIIHAELLAERQRCDKLTEETGVWKAMYERQCDTVEALTEQCGAERQRAQEAIAVEHGPSESAAADLLEAVKILKEDYADSEGCYCGQLIGGADSDGLPLRKCGYCKAVNAIAKATALSNAATGPEAGSTRRDK